MCKYGTASAAGARAFLPATTAYRVVQALRLGDARMERGTLKYKKYYKFGHRRALSKHYQQPVPKMGKNMSLDMEKI